MRADIQKQNTGLPIPGETVDCPLAGPARVSSDSEPARRPSIPRGMAISPWSCSYALSPYPYRALPRNPRMICRRREWRTFA